MPDILSLLPNNVKQYSSMFLCVSKIVCYILKEDLITNIILEDTFNTVFKEVSDMLPCYPILFSNIFSGYLLLYVQNCLLHHKIRSEKSSCFRQSVVGQ